MRGQAQLNQKEYPDTEKKKESIKEESIKSNQTPQKQKYNLSKT